MRKRERMSADGGFSEKTAVDCGSPHPLKHVIEERAVLRAATRVVRCPWRT